MHNHFQLKHEALYSHHPNLAQYFVPVTDVEFRQRLERHRGEIAIMLRSVEFNQDKTTLIVTNNPLPLLITGQHLSSPFQYFPKDLFGRSAIRHEPSGLPPLKTPQKQLTAAPTRKWKKPVQFSSSFSISKNSAIRHEPSGLPPLKTPQKQLTAAPTRKWKKPVQFRYAADKDFKSEAQFSRAYAERRLQRLYPSLRAHSRPDQQKTEALPSIQGFAARTPQWEPLTISCLTETKPTIAVPGEDGFRYGKAPLWIVNSSVVPKNGK
nr:testis-specific gene 13 protein [Pogona vitticeps]